MVSRFFFFITFLFSFSLLFSEAESGSIDVLGKLSEKNSTIKLDGEWEFYWKEFIPPVGNSVKPSSLITVPGYWTDNSTYSSWGYGSYRLLIKNLVPGKIYSLYIGDVYSNYNLYINGNLVSQNGVVSSNPMESIPQSLPKIVSFTTKAPTVELVIHISNYDYRVSGIWRSLILGSEDGVRNFEFSRLFIDIFVIGILLAVSLLHFGIYFYRKVNRTPFIFAIICFSIIFRVMNTGEQLMTRFFPGISWEIIRKLEFLPFFITTPLFIVLTTKLFPEESINKINRFFYISCSGILGVFILVTPMKFANYSVPVAEVLIGLIVFYLIFIVVKAVIHRRDFSILYTITFGVFFIAVFNDILYALMVIQSIYIGPLFFIIAIIGQSQIQTKQFIHRICETDKIEESRDFFMKISDTDALTSLYNSRFLYRTLTKSIKDTLDTRTKLSLIMIDVDDFKMYNDTYGHTMGDKVLRSIANSIKSSARDHDLICRYGGEEFTIILPDTDIEEAKKISERIRLNVEHNTSLLENNLIITISLGVTELLPEDSSKSIIERADKALYIAKKQGKNRVEVL